MQFEQKTLSEIQWNPFDMIGKQWYLLTAADIVIHYDPWWNLAAQNQATDRAYRIGQRNPVQVYRLIAQDTIEEKIVELQQAKQSLADTVTGGADGAILSMNPEQLLQLLGEEA